MTRYPLEPLMEAMRCPSVHALGQQLNIAGSTLQLYRDSGLTARVADRLAIAAGLHPAMVWPSWIDDGLSVVDRLFIEGGWRQAWLWDEEQAA